ncbi:MAG: chaperone modulator CbpM [Rhodoferax sp.]|nr:chaperone modulator CbpM [Rhodoferax sp.]
MPIQVFDATLQQPMDYLSTAEVITLCELNEEEIAELIEYGALSSDMEVEENIFFSAQRVQHLKTASQHRRDYDLDLFAVVLLMGYLQEIADLKQQVINLQAIVQQSIR